MTATDQLGEGSIRSLFLKLALPAVVAQVVSLLYNIVDRIYIGHMADVGAAALTGAGLFVPILTLINAFAMLVGSGGAPMASINLGKGDRERAEKILGNSFTVLVLISVALTLVLYLLAPALLKFFGASSVTYPYAIAYARIYILGTIFVALTLGMNLFISGQGFAKTSMLTTVIGAVINIVLDPILIFGAGMGVRGAAIATVISQAVSCVWTLRFLMSEKSTIRLARGGLALQKKIVLPCLGLGVSTFVMLATESLLSITYNHSLAHYGGDVAVGAMTIITSVMSLVNMPLNGLAQGGAPLISYNYGAGKGDRVRKTFYLLLGTSAGYALLCWAIVMAAPGAVAGIFTTDASLIRYTSRSMRIYFAAIFCFGFQCACQQSFVALGQAKISLFLACLRKLILLIPLILILPHVTSDPVFGVFLAEPVSDATAAAVTTGTFFARLKGILASGKHEE